MIKIRLAKKGFKNNVFYRIVAIEEKLKNTGEAKEVLGYWHPKKGKPTISLDRIKDWVSKGAQISPAVKKLMSK
jgi:small subunit ribosomal protein S16